MSSVLTKTPGFLDELWLRLRFQETAQPGWINGVTFHTGSKLGNSKTYAEQTEYIAGHLPNAGISIAAYGAGQAGKMGKFGKAAIDAGMYVYGVTLPFFLAAQGEDFPGTKATLVADTMHDRMRVMRRGRRALLTDPSQLWKARNFNGTQAAVMDTGGVGTIEEGLEWLISRNGIVKPQIVNNYGGYWDGLHEFLEVCSDNGYRVGSDVKRIVFADDAKDVITKLREINSRSAVLEPEHRIDRDNTDRFVVEWEKAIIVKPGAGLGVMSAIFSRLVTYDVSNIPGQTLHNKNDTIKPVIFADGEYFGGIRKQITRMFESGFAATERDVLYRFSSDTREAYAMARRMNYDRAIRPEDLGTKHAEAAKPAPKAF